MSTHSQKFIKERQFMVVVPCIILPFITLLFWALGGGKGLTSQDSSSKLKAGFNFELPSANLKKDVDGDKLALYESQEKDSLDKEREKLEDHLKQFGYKYSSDSGRYLETTITQADPEDNLPFLETGKLIGESGGKPAGINSSTMQRDPRLDENEERVNKKLNELNHQLKVLENSGSKSFTSTSPDESNKIQNERRLPSDPTTQKLDEMMASLISSKNKGTGEEDPEMKEMQDLLDKVLDIQHPERVKERLKEQSAKNKGKVYAVNTKKDEAPISLLQQNQSDKEQSLEAIYALLINRNAEKSQSTGIDYKRERKNGFYSDKDLFESDAERENAIQAVVHETQTIVSGGQIKLRLLDDLFINGKLIPKDEFVYGICTINGDRLTVEIKSIRHKNSLFPVSLSVYDMDGIPGIYTPGAIEREAGKNAAGQAASGVNIMSMDPSIGAQAASAGIQAGKTLLSKKVKLVKVTVKANYQILLFDEKNNK